MKSANEDTSNTKHFNYEKNEVERLMENDNSITVTVEQTIEANSSKIIESEQREDTIVMTREEDREGGAELRTQEGSPISHSMLAPTPLRRSKKLETPPPTPVVSGNQENMHSIHQKVAQKLENENFYMNLVELLTNRIFCGGGNPAQFRKAITDEIAGRWGASVWDEEIPDVLTRKIDNMVGDMEIKYHQLAFEEKRNRVSEMMNSTQRSSQMESLFGTIEVSDDSDSEEDGSGDDSFGNMEIEKCKTPVSFSRRIPLCVFDCMKSSDATLVATGECPEEKESPEGQGEQVYIPRALKTVVDETVGDVVSPRLVNLMHSILPPTPRPISEPRRAKSNATTIAPATDVKKKGGRLVKQLTNLWLIRSPDHCRRWR